MNQFLKTLFLGSLLLISTGIHAQSFNKLKKKGDQQFELHAFQNAIDTYLEALQKRDDEEVLARIGDSYRFLNNMNQAAQYYGRAIGQKKVDEDVYFHYGQVLKALGDYNGAKQMFQEYARFNPDLGNHYIETCDFAVSQFRTPSEFSVEVERVSSLAADFGPAYLLDQLVFSSARTDVQRSTYDWDGQAKNQLFVSRISPGGDLQPPVFLQENNEDFGQAFPSFSGDGNQMAFTRNNFVSGVRQIPGSGMELAIYMGEASRNGQWSNFTPFTHNDREGKTGYPHFTTNGQAMFFASDRPEGFGGYDIYISYRDGNSWSAPINLGPVVNTPGNEVAPFFDGTDLYFTSDYHPGFGGYDLFKATQNNGQWSNIQNLGLPMNSGYDDYALVFQPLQGVGFFSSNRPGGIGAEDIYRVSRAGSGGGISIKVVNIADGSGVPFATIDLSTCGFGQNGVTDNRGIFNASIRPQNDCEALVRAQGYLDGRVRISPYTIQGGGAIEVGLTRSDEAYYGRVISQQTRQGVYNATISVRNMNTNAISKVTADQSGNFTLGLRNNTAYLITYSAPGFQDLNRQINTYSGTDKNILGTVSMLASGQAPPPYPPNPEPGGGGIQAGFAIQIAALSKAPDLSKFSALERYGQVYTVSEGGKYKVRVGVYDSRSEASQNLSGVKSAGYGSAFVVAESGTGTSSTSGGYTPPNNPSAGSGKGSRFMIQLGAYRNTKYFDPGPVANMGTIIDWNRENLTIKLLSGFNDVGSARSALPQVQRSGFEKAFIVENINGGLARVQ